MTEERIKKMAEDYFCDGCENSFEHDNGHCDNCSKIQFYSAGVKDGYHECLKEHEWHDLEKDPKDLPKHTNSVLAYCRGDYYDICFFNGKRLIGHGESDFLKWKEIE